MLVATSTDGTNHHKMYHDANVAVVQLMAKCRHGIIRDYASGKVIWVLYNRKLYRPKDFIAFNEERKLDERIDELLMALGVNKLRQRWRKA